MTFSITKARSTMERIARHRLDGTDAQGVIALFDVVIEEPKSARRPKYKCSAIRTLIAHTVTKKGGSLEHTENSFKDALRKERDKVGRKIKKLNRELAAATLSSSRDRLQMRIEDANEQLERLRKGIPSVRVVKRYLKVMGLNDLWRLALQIFNLGFHLFIRRENLLHRGYYVCIDENQTEFYGRRRLKPSQKQQGKKVTTSGVTAVRAKKGKNPGATGGHEYFVMTAHFFGSKLTLPLVIFHRPLNRSSKLIIESFLRQLRQFKPLPKYIFFDRGFASNDVYQVLLGFARETGVNFVTPAKSDWGSKKRQEIFQGKPRPQRKIREIAADECPKETVGNSDLQLRCRYSHWVIAKNPDALLALVAYWQPERVYQAGRKSAKEAAEDDAEEQIGLEIGDQHFVAFFTSCNLHLEGIAPFFHLYSSRWALECTFRRRASVAANGKFHQYYYRALFYVLSYCLLVIHALRRLDQFEAMGDRIHRDGQSITVFVEGLHKEFADLEPDPGD
jgi:hypothetical protein